jgi:hypothetical protein|tara:strand:- start:525 stop:668 length:144 start_codon:yes stop_codon:yes gene_type:complete
MGVLSIIGVTVFVIILCRYILIDGQRTRRQKKFMDNMRKNNFDKSGK